MISIRQEIEVIAKGDGIKSTIGGLQQVEKQAEKAQGAVSRTTAGVSKFADAVGKTSTTLARSADAFGLPAGALRTLDDVMDVTEIGFNGLNKGALTASMGIKSFQLSLLGPVAAAAAVGAAIGSLLNRFESVRKGADALTGSIGRFLGILDDVDPKGLTSGLKEFRAEMGVKHEEALAKQVQSLRDQGLSVKEISAFYKGTLNPELMKRLGLTEKAMKAEEQILKANQKQKDELVQIGRIFRGEQRGLVDLFKAATTASTKDLMMPGLATGVSEGRRSSVTAAGGDLMGQLMMPQIQTTLSLDLFKTWELEKKGKEAAATAGEKLVGSLGTLANQLTNLSQQVGGFAGKLLSIAASLSSGAGGLVSGIGAWKDASASKGLLGTLGKVSAGLGIFGSAVGAIGGLVGGIKSLFGGKSKEQKAAEAAAKKQAEEEKKAAAEAAKQAKLESLKSAQAAAQSIMDRLAGGGFSERLGAALGTLIGKVQDALLKSGLGFMAAGPLRDSKEFGAAQGMANDVAQLLAGLRTGGALDTDVLSAAGASAEELRQQATAAAAAAGLAPAEATKAGFGAIAPLLREQLNAALASGQELDANTKALIEEAKKNGVTILADPMVESVAVQKDMLGELRSLNRNGGGESADAGFASGTSGLKRVKRDMLAKIHEGEGLMVIPREEMGRTAFRSFARGTERERDPILQDRRTGGGDVGSGTTGTATTMTIAGAGSVSSASDLDAIAEKVASRVQTVQITNAPTVQIVDQSVVRTIEGQKRFERETVSAVERALDQNARGLESRIERIARRAVG